MSLLRIASSHAGSCIELAAACRFAEQPRSIAAASAIAATSATATTAATATAVTTTTATSVFARPCLIHSERPAVE